MASERNIDDEEEQFTQAFGEHLDGIISQESRSEIQMIKNNHPNVTMFTLSSYLANCLSELAWELLGRYIANNNYLLRFNLSGIDLTDENTTILFNSLVKSSSLKELMLYANHIGMNGVRSMIPFLRNSPNLSLINLGNNKDICTEEFEVLINALDGGNIKILYLHDCNIEDISVLANCTLPHLRELHLSGNSIRNVGAISTLQNYTNMEILKLENNSIGREGCIVISHLLQKEDSRLEVLDLDSNDIDDEGAEILAASLKHNNTLVTLYLIGNNNLEEKGCLAFLKLLIDVSSIDSAHNSNHTLKTLTLPDSTLPSCSGSQVETKIHISSAISINKNSPGSAGKAKIINFQLNNQT